MAAARNVSAAASITCLPSPCSCAASLPMVVVLPVPLTPTTRMTCGLCAPSTTSGLATGASTRSTSLLSTERTSSALMSLSKRPLRSAVMMFSAVPTPRSASMSRSSRSSSVAASSFFLVKMPVMPSESFADVLPRPCLRRPNQPAALAGAAAFGRCGRGSPPVRRRSCLLPPHSRPKAPCALLAALAHATTSPASRWPSWPLTRATHQRRPRQSQSASAFQRTAACARRHLLDEQLDLGAGLAVEEACQGRRALAAQLRGALLHDGAFNLRHARGRRALARREREHVQIGEVAVVDDAQGVREHLVGLGRETRR